MIHNYRIGAIDDNGELLGFVSELKGLADEDLQTYCRDGSLWTPPLVDDAAITFVFTATPETLAKLHNMAKPRRRQRLKRRMI